MFFYTIRLNRLQMVLLFQVTSSYSSPCAGPQMAASASLCFVLSFHFSPSIWSIYWLYVYTGHQMECRCMYAWFWVVVCFIVMLARTFLSVPDCLTVFRIIKVVICRNLGKNSMHSCNSGRKMVRFWSVFRNSVSRNDDFSYALMCPSTYFMGRTPAGEGRCPMK